MPQTRNLHETLSPAKETCAFWTIFLLAFGLLFVVAVLAKLVGLPWRELFPGAEKTTGMVRGVEAAVYTLMSHII